MFAMRIIREVTFKRDLTEVRAPDHLPCYVKDEPVRPEYFQGYLLQKPFNLLVPLAPVHEADEHPSESASEDLPYLLADVSFR